MYIGNSVSSSVFPNTCPLYYFQYAWLFIWAGEAVVGREKLFQNFKSLSSPLEAALGRKGKWNLFLIAFWRSSIGYWFRNGHRGIRSLGYEADFPCTKPSMIFWKIHENSKNRFRSFPVVEIDRLKIISVAHLQTVTGFHFFGVCDTPFPSKKSRFSQKNKKTPTDLAIFFWNPWIPLKPSEAHLPVSSCKHDATNRFLFPIWYPTQTFLIFAIDLHVFSFCWKLSLILKKIFVRSS